jgi:menaquinone-dependent protoporphyrinogen IX oxidase
MLEIRKGIIEIFPESEIFYMRGRLSYKELSFPEKILIKMINKESKKKELQSKLDIEKAIGQVVAEDGVDFINLNELEVIE